MVSRCQLSQLLGEREKKQHAKHALLHAVKKKLTKTNHAFGDNKVNWRDFDKSFHHILFLWEMQACMIWITQTRISDDFFMYYAFQNRFLNRPICEGKRGTWNNMFTHMFVCVFIPVRRLS